MSKLGLWWYKKKKSILFINAGLHVLSVRFESRTSSWLDHTHIWWEKKRMACEHTICSDLGRCSMNDVRCCSPSLSPSLFYRWTSVTCIDGQVRVSATIKALIACILRTSLCETIGELFFLFRRVNPPVSLIQQKWSVFTLTQNCQLTITIDRVTVWPVVTMTSHTSNITEVEAAAAAAYSFLFSFSHSSSNRPHLPWVWSIYFRSWINASLQ